MASQAAEQASPLKLTNGTQSDVPATTTPNAMSVASSVTRVGMKKRSPTTPVFAAPNATPVTANPMHLIITNVLQDPKQLLETFLPQIMPVVAPMIAPVLLSWAAQYFGILLLSILPYNAWALLPFTFAMALLLVPEYSHPLFQGIVDCILFEWFAFMNTETPIGRAVLGTFLVVSQLSTLDKDKIKVIRGLLWSAAFLFGLWTPPVFFQVPLLSLIALQLVVGISFDLRDCVHVVGLMGVWIGTTQMSMVLLWIAVMFLDNVAILYLGDSVWPKWIASTVILAMHIGSLVWGWTLWTHICLAIVFVHVPYVSVGVREVLNK